MCAALLALAVLAAGLRVVDFPILAAVEVAGEPVSVCQLNLYLCNGGVVVPLAGVDSVMCPIAERVEAWQRLAAELDLAKLDAVVTEVTFGEVVETAPRFLKGEVRGRIVVPVDPELG